MQNLVSMRRAFGEALLALGEQNQDVVVLSADVANSDHSSVFGERFPERFFNVGIAEQALVDVAVGLALAGKIPFANTFAFLFATRALEMVRTHLCYGGANVKLMAAYAGLSDSYDGPTHQEVSDLAIMRSLPGMTVIIPSDAASVFALLPQVATWVGPVYFRINRNEVPDIHVPGVQARIGEALVLREGKDLTILGTGMGVSRSLVAADELEGRGTHCRVLDVHTLKPLDVGAVRRAAEDTGAIVTVEEHSILGGLGGAVAEVLAGSTPVPVVRVGLADRFAETGPYDALLDRYGLSVDSITAAADEALRLKAERQVRGAS